ncbi:MAG: D-alanyl-D-alanine carboxypeptidase/D-alanyl-D-alanine-endopeptidase [Planctomycetes bacterium RBG_13_44_8b]|nr:MAG: D-alanyl-D-alanine carboxypeptidase/D-alanyl-D-alanine-endopeptidase [Planctomycetes bacterium RBG_13_44_8b]
MRKFLIITVLSICLESIAQADLTKEINGIIRRSSQRNVQFSILVVKADSGDTVYSHEATKAMTPASNMKIIITTAALKYLGPAYEYKTKVGLTSNTLVIIGSGDPLLGDEVTDTKYGRKKYWILNDIATALKSKDIKVISDIIVDSNVFDDQLVHPSWPKAELNRWYACEVCGLNYNDNCVQISAENKVGEVSVFIDPQTKYIQFINNVKPVSSGDSLIGSYRSLEPNKITVFGKCKKQVGPFDVAIERPAAFFAFLLAEHLTKAGINISGHIVEKPVPPESIIVLAEYKTPIADCLARSNKNSLGLAAEALLKTIAVESNPNKKNGSWSKGREVVSQYLSELGIDSSQFYIDDGSGLSEQNKLSVNALTKVLLSVYKSENWQLYKDSLAVGGVDGTIAGAFKDKKYKGKIFGKTGYISTVKSFSGVCSTEQGDYIFSIITNKANGQTRQAINDIAEAIIDYADK